MNWSADEIMFYGGIIIAVCSFIMAILYFTILHTQKIRLEMWLDEEYGKKENRNE